MPENECGELLEPARLVGVLVAENARLSAENARLVSENRLLRDKVDLLVRRVFGSSSEKLDANQMLLDLGAGEEPAFDEQAPAGEEAPPAPRKKRAAKRDRLPDDLPEERTVIEPPEVEACPGDWRLIGTEKTVKLDVEPMRFKKVVIEDIQELYRVEAGLREAGAGAQQREARRGAESAPMLAALKAKLESHRPHHLPQSLTGKAIAYTLERWDGLTMYVGNGEMEIDNNLVENAIRPSAIGKKNWLFFGSESGGWQNAVMYTIVQNCKMHGINPKSPSRTCSAACRTSRPTRLVNSPRPSGSPHARRFHAPHNPPPSRLSKLSRLRSRADGCKERVELFGYFAPSVDRDVPCRLFRERGAKPWIVVQRQDGVRIITG